MIIASQIRAARGLAAIGQKDLADRAGISVATLRRMENDDIGPERSASGAVNKVQSALEAAGIVFLFHGDPASGPGVSLRRD